MMTIEKKINASQILTKAQQTDDKLSRAFGVDSTFKIGFNVLTKMIGSYVHGSANKYSFEVSEDELFTNATNTGILGHGVAMADANHKELIMDAVSVCRELHDLLVDDCKGVNALAWN